MEEHRASEFATSQVVSACKQQMDPKALDQDIVEYLLIGVKDTPQQNGISKRQPGSSPVVVVGIGTKDCSLTLLRLETQSLAAHN